MGLVFVYVMTLVGAIAGLFEPFAGLVVYVCFAILKPESVWPWSVSAGNFSRIVAVAMLIGWALKGFGRWDLGRGKAVVVALLGYSAWMVASAVQATDQERAWGFVERYTKILPVILVGVSTIRSVRQLKILAWVILLSQAYPALELNRMYFSGYNRLREDGFGSLDNNGYACALVTSVGLAGFLVWHSERWWQKALATVSAAFIVHAVLFSNSRGAMLGLVVLAATAFAVMPKGRKEISAFAMGAVMVLAFAGPQVWARFESSFADERQRDSSAESRLELWSACLDLALKNPILGIGPNNFPVFADRYGFFKGKEAHTLWILCGAEMGFPAMFMLLAYYSICMVRLWPIAQGRVPVDDPWLIYLARMVIASLVGFAVAAQFLSLAFLETPYYLAMMGAVILKLAGDPSAWATQAEEMA